MIVASQIIEQKQNYLPAATVFMVAMTTSNLPSRRDSGFSKVAKQNSAAVTAFSNAGFPKRLIELQIQYPQITLKVCQRDEKLLAYSIFCQQNPVMLKSNYLWTGPFKYKHQHRFLMF